MYKWNRISCIRVVVLSALCLALGGFFGGQTQADSDNPLIAVRKASSISLRLNRMASAKAQIVGHPASSDLTAILSLGIVLPAPSLLGSLCNPASHCLPVPVVLGAPNGRAPPLA
jgi:hypothetical protein